MTAAGPGGQGPYLFALVDGGGVAVNLRTGSWAGLNSSAAAICEAFDRRQSWEDARTMVTLRWGLDPLVAARAVSDVQEALEQPVAPLGSEDVPYRRNGDEYVLYHHEQPILGVDRAAQVVRVLAPAERRRAPLGHYLRLVSPKVLAAHGRLVLHAAACRFGGQLKALIGASGAGKTTTSNLLHSLGFLKVADDMLVVAEPSEDGTVRALPGAEARIYAWCDQAASAMNGASQGFVGTAGLLAATAVESIPLSGIWFFDGQRLPGPSFSTRPLGKAEALERLMGSGFLGGTEPARLALYLEGHRHLSQRVPVDVALVPQGVDRLRDALARYTANKMS